MDHKYICKFERCFEDKENVYILLELCESETVNHIYKKRKVLTEPEVKYYVFQLLLAIIYLHRKNVVHRDLKLGNLFLSKNMNMKLGKISKYIFKKKVYIFQKLYLMSR